MQTFWDNRDTLESVRQFGLCSVWHELEYQWDVCRVVYGLTRASLTAHVTFTLFLCLCVCSSNHGKSVHLDKLTVTLNVTLEWVALLHLIWEIPGSNPVPETNWCDWDVSPRSVSQSKCWGSTLVMQWLLPSTFFPSHSLILVFNTTELQTAAKYK